MSDGEAARCGLHGADGQHCGNDADLTTGLNLCTGHLLAAYEHVETVAGVTDTLPTPCRACGSRLGVRYPSGWLCAICEWKLGESPDGGLRIVRVDVVYYLRLGQTVKIGTSGNPRARLRQLRYDELLAFERGDRHREQARHQQFGGYCIRGSEWFSTHPELELHIEQLRAGVEDPWDQYALWRSESIALTQ